MTERIKQLTEATLAGQMYVQCVDTPLPPWDERGSRIENETLDLCRYILNQEPKITEHCAFTGRFNFNGQVVGDAFGRSGHRYTDEAMRKYYLKPQENLSTMEWQHATADYKRVLEMGLEGIISQIDLSLACHDGDEDREFLQGLKRVALALIAWSEKCSQRVAEYVKGIDDKEAKARLERLSGALLRVPRGKPADFYEAVLCIYVCFSADPDSLGTLDRFLSPFYFEGIKNGTLARDEAKEYLQELFLMVQSSTHKDSPNFTRGGQSHFCIGGYGEDGEDVFNDLSRLITEAMVELPTYIPQVTLRWTPKMSYGDFCFMMEQERRDPHKRIAFTNDQKRIKCYTEICGFPYERAVSYTMVGCNEPAFLGAITGSNSKGNILRCMETLFHKRAGDVLACEDFESFYALFENELFCDLEKILAYDDMYNLERAKDYSYISSLFFGGCIENARSLTQGGGDVVIASPMLIGITNLIDSLITVKQFVFDTGVCTLKELTSALEADWQGYEALRQTIIKKGAFFGNGDEYSYVGKRVYQSLYRFYNGKKNAFGYPWLVGDLLGYNEHHRWFGEKTLATPDGRRAGENLKFGIGQSQGRDRGGLWALLSSVAELDPMAIGCGATVTNISVDRATVENDDSFEKLCKMLWLYLERGGVHFQLTYVSVEDLINAQAEPEKYKHIRVRVTGFSDYFVNLKESIQNDIIERTVKK